MNRLIRLLPVAALFVVACQPAATPAPSTPPATAQPKAAAASPAAAPASPAAVKPGASPAAAASPAAKPAASPAAPGKPANLANIRIAVSGEGEWVGNSQKATNFNKVPSGLALESLVKDGVGVEASFLNQSEAPMQALVQGSVDMAQTAFTSAIAGIEKGARAKIVLTTRRPEYVMVALKEMTKPQDFQGKRVAIHSNVSTVALLTSLYLHDTPDVKPNIVVIPGSPNRIQAMLAGQIDASVVQLGDDDAIMAQQPGKWHVVFSYSKEMPRLTDSVLVVRDDFLAANRATVVEYVKRTVAEHRKANANLQGLIEDARRMNVTLPAGASLENHAKRYVEGSVFPNDGGLSSDTLEFTIKAVQENGFIQTQVPVNTAADVTVLRDALAQLGS